MKNTSKEKSNSEFEEDTIVNLNDFNFESDPKTDWESNEDLSRLKELIVNNGEVITIQSGNHPPFSRVEIQKGGVLRCSGQSNWLMIYSKGDFILNGIIECKDYEVGLKKISETSPNPDNENLEVIYPETSIGGNGGDSIDWNPARNRGTGAIGTTNYGGGGASGRGSVCKPKHSCYSYSSSGKQGGINPNSIMPNGGNGGSKREFQNGGCIYLKIDGKLSSDDGIIDIRGSNGTSGLNGENSNNYQTLRGRKYPVDPAHGGGGAPGGDGGLLVIKIDAENITSKPKILNQGGIGGPGGDLGRKIDGSIPRQRITNRQRAKNGQSGNNGKPTIWITGWGE